MANGPYLKALTLEQWQTFDAQHPAPTFHARPAWALALHDENPQVIPAPHTLHMPNGEVVLLPLMRLDGGRLGWRRYEGVPQDGHNVFVTMDGNLVDGDLLREVLAALTRCKLDRLELNFSPALTVLETPSWSARRFDASILDLRGGADTALDRMNAATRRMAEQAQRLGIQCSSRTDAEAIEIFYNLQPERWANTRSLISKRFLQVLVEHAGSDVEIWLAYHEGNPIAGAVVLYGSVESYVCLTAVVPEIVPLRPFTLLHVSTVRAAAARGIRWFNLGSSDGLPDVKRFKDALGAPTIPYARLTFEKSRFKLYRRIRERTVAR